VVTTIPQDDNLLPTKQPFNFTENGIEVQITIISVVSVFILIVGIACTITIIKYRKKYEFKDYKF
jgi:hypothetical protein